MAEVVKYACMPNPEQKSGKIDKLLKAGVYLNFITVPLAIAFGRIDLAFIDLLSGAAIEESRKKIKNIRGRFRLGSNSRLVMAGGGAY